MPGDEPNAADVLAAARQTVPNTLASHTRELAALLDCLADLPIQGPDLPPHPYRVAAANLLDHAAIVAAFAKPYPDAIRAEAFAIVAAVQAVAEPIRDGQADALLAVSGRDAGEHARQAFAGVRDRYSRRLADLADRAAGHDIEHGEPKPTTPDGEYTPAQLAETLRTKRTKRKQGRPAESNPEADRKLAEQWEAMRQGGHTYSTAARELGTHEHILRAAVERHRKR